MNDSAMSRRRAQAERELGRTTVGSAVAWLLSLALLATTVAVPVAEEIGRQREDSDGAPTSRPLVGLLRALPAAASTARGRGLLAANRRLQEEIDLAETSLEDESLLRAWLLPPVQRTLLGLVGLGNEQVYPGRDGWLFYRSDLDHVTGPGFLEPAVLRGRERGGDAWTPPPRPDPLPAILALRAQLARRGVELLVMPTPVKPTIHPEWFSRRAAGAARRGVENRSYGEFLSSLRAAGVGVFDPAPLLARALEELPEPLYLRTDTHWRPPAMELAAAELASHLTANFDLGAADRAYLERPSSVEGRGDLFAMLSLPGDQRSIAAERVEVRSVVESTGRSWRPQTGAPVLLLGDSFTNVFSDARLGWGAAAGLAERLSFHLRRPVDRVAVNAGGAHASREALARQLAGDRERLAGTVVVVYQFATRELSFGDWKAVSLD